MNNKRRVAIGLLILTSVLWGYSFIYTSQLINNGFSSDLIIIGRYYIGVIALAILANKKLFKIRKADIKAGVIVGFFLLIAMYTQNLSMAYTSVSKAAFISGMNIVLVPFFAYFLLKSRITRKNIIGLVLAVAGTAFLSIDVKNFTNINFGDMLSAISAVALAMQVISLKKFGGETTATGLALFQMLTVAVGGTIIYLFNDSPTPELLTPNVIEAFLYLGIFTSAICYLILAWSSRYVDEVTLSVLPSSQGLFAVIFDLLILHTILNGQAVIGIILMSVAVLYFAFASDNGKIYFDKIFKKK